MRKWFVPLFSLLIFLPIFTGSGVKSGQIKGPDILTLDAKETASVMQVGTLYEDSKMFVSEVYETKQPFELLGLNWKQALPEGTEAGMEIKFRDLDGNWSDWEALTPDDGGPDNAVDNTLWTYVITDSSDAFQYRVALSTNSPSITPKLSDISFDYVDGGETSIVTKMERMIFNDGSVVTRSQWGADESLRLSKNFGLTSNDTFTSELDTEEVEIDPEMEITKRVDTDENGDSLLWPLEYSANVKKIIIHHTASSNSSLGDPEASIRAIYYYHAVTRGWGDIGYNYIVAPDGTVYEGRAGGDGVVGGHAAGYNTGSIGISILGNYDEKPIPAEMMQGLMGLLYEKADLFDIDPTGEDTFRGEDMPNILGHRDVDATACPGKYAYSELENIRNMVGLALDDSRHENSSTSYSYEEVGDRELVAMDTEDTSTVTIKIKNTGTKTWSKSTFLAVNANYSADSIVDIPKDSQKRTAVMKETSVKPGATATFTFEVESSMNGGLASFDMAPVFNGTEKTKTEMELNFYVDPPVLEFSTTKIDSPSLLKPGTTGTVTVTLKNTGNTTWKNSGDNKVTLQLNGTSSLASKTELSALKETSVEPGKTGTFSFSVKAPTKGGTYKLYFGLKMANSNAVAVSSAQLSVNVSETTEDAIVTADSSSLTLNSGESKTLWITVKNTSTKTWTTSGSSAFKLIFSASSTMKASFTKTSLKSISPNVSTKAYFTLTAPEKAGTYTLEIRPRLGSTNLTKEAYKMTITVFDEEDWVTEKYEDPVRIKLTPTSEVSSPIITSDGAFGLYDDDELLKVFAGGSRVKVTNNDGTFAVSSGSLKWTINDAVKLVPEEGGIMEVATMSEIPTWNTSLNDNLFRGTIEVADVDGETVLINELPLEDYLKGIGEVSNTDNTEKIKTIIVLARTYATYYTTEGNIKFAGKPYDLEDDPNTSQKYLGYGFELRAPNVVKAVENTEGMVVTYKDKVVITPYFSQSDGVATKSAKDVWGWTNTPWLVSVPDTYCDSDEFAGHGVGLSGCGATALAESGETFDEIIKYYYTGVSIEKL